jgi:hypothetical protein
VQVLLVFQSEIILFRERLGEKDNFLDEKMRPLLAAGLDKPAVLFTLNKTVLFSLSTIFNILNKTLRCQSYSTLSTILNTFKHSLHSQTYIFYIVNHTVLYNLNYPAVVSFSATRDCPARFVWLKVLSIYRSLLKGEAPRLSADFDLHL